MYTIPLLGTWHHYDEIDFGSLSFPCILKCNHDSDSWTIIKDLDHFDQKSCKYKIEAALKRDFYHYDNRQWGYKDIPHMILAEPYLDGKEKLEYQIFCNNGEPVFFLIRKDLGENEFIGKGWNVCYIVDWKKVKYRGDNSDSIFLPKPTNYVDMLHIAKVLSHDTLHLRVDFLEVDSRLYVGELTFYSHGGDFCNFNKDGIEALSSTLILPINRA